MYVPPDGPPQKPVDRGLYQKLGEDAIRRMLSLHYRNLGDTSIRDMFPEDLEEAAQRSADFFIQIMGGPAYFNERYGPPRMRMRHQPFPITEEARQLWMQCFREALDELPFPEEDRPDFEEFLESFSRWMVNTAS